MLGHSIPKGALQALNVNLIQELRSKNKDVTSCSRKRSGIEIKNQLVRSAVWHWAGPIPYLVFGFLIHGIDQL